MASTSRYAEESQAIASARSRARSRSHVRRRSAALAEESGIKKTSFDAESLSDIANVVEERDFKHKQVGHGSHVAEPFASD